MVRKALILGVSLAAASLMAHEQKPDSALADAESIFQFIDGIPSPFGIDYHYYGLMRIMRKNLLGILEGNEKYVGYVYENKKYTLIQLKEIELQVEHHALKACIETIKHDFEEMVAPFLDCARRSPKAPLLKLMQASCELHNTPDSFILKWAVAEEGNELALFHKEINTVEKLHEFFRSLVNFFDFMLSNCPKARHQWIEMGQKKLAERHAA